MKKRFFPIAFLLSFFLFFNVSVAADVNKLQEVISQSSTDDLVMLRELIDAELERRYTAIKSIREDETSFTLNVNSKKFHIPSCDSAKRTKEKNKIEFQGDREDLIDMGYSPCAICHP